MELPKEFNYAHVIMMVYKNNFFKMLNLVGRHGMPTEGEKLEQFLLAEIHRIEYEALVNRLTENVFIKPMDVSFNKDTGDKYMRIVIGCLPLGGIRNIDYTIGEYGLTIPHIRSNKPVSIKILETTVTKEELTKPPLQVQG